MDARTNGDAKSLYPLLLLQCNGWLTAIGESDMPSGSVDAGRGNHSQVPGTSRDKSIEQTRYPQGCRLGNHGKADEPQYPSCGSVLGPVAALSVAWRVTQRAGWSRWQQRDSDEGGGQSDGGANEGGPVHRVGVRGARDCVSAGCG